MTHKYIIDTHALVWYLEGNRKLGDNAKTVMSNPDTLMVLPLIAVAEAAFLIEKKRIGIPSVEELFQDILADERIEIMSLNWDIFERSLTVEGMKIPELHDRFIVSTGLYLQDRGNTVDIITRDVAITQADVLSVTW